MTFASIPLKDHFLSVASLIPKTIEEMSALYLAHYDESSEALFLHDLLAKNWVLLLEEQSRLVGFSTLQLYDYNFRGQKVRVLFSGDTIVHQDYWGQQTLSTAWLSHVGRIWRENPSLPLYWFLLVKGHRTFKYLSVFGKEFIPHWKPPETEEEALRRLFLQDLAHDLARHKFGEAFLAGKGIIRFPSAHGQLKDSIAIPSHADIHKPAVRFFLDKNPSYQKGDELLCLTQLHPENMKPFAARIFANADAKKLA